MSDWSELVIAIKAGERSAGPMLVSVLAPMLDRYAARIASDLSQREREDAVQVALTTVVRKIDRYDDGVASLPSWARAFVRHALEDVRRGPREEVVDPGDLGEVERVDNPEFGAEPSVSPAHVAITSLLLTAVGEADQLLITLHVHERLTFEEISAALGGPPPTAVALRQRFARAKRKLRDAAAKDADLMYLAQGSEA